MKLAGIACVGLLLAGSAGAQEGGKAITKTTISLGTATPGGGFPVYGNAFAEVMNAADPALSIEPRNTKGSNENIPLLESDQLEEEKYVEMESKLRLRHKPVCHQKSNHCPHRRSTPSGKPNRQCYRAEQREIRSGCAQPRV